MGITFLITLWSWWPLAFGYLYFADNIYLIHSSILLNGDVKNGLNPRNSSREWTPRFAYGIGRWSWNSEILQSLGKHDPEIGFWDYVLCKIKFPSFDAMAGSIHSKIELDSTVNQIVEVPIFIERLTDSTYSIEPPARRKARITLYEYGWQTSSVYSGQRYPA